MYYFTIPQLSLSIIQQAKAVSPVPSVQSLSWYDSFQGAEFSSSVILTAVKGVTFWNTSLT